MHTEPAIKPPALPVAAIAPTPVGAETGARRPVRFVLAKVMSTLRGDKYMVDAYPADPPAAPSETPSSKGR